VNARAIIFLSKQSIVTSIATQAFLESERAPHYARKCGDDEDCQNYYGY
jgi:hypothetical protein